MSINIYVETNLFGLDCPVMDTSYVVYNLYKRRWKLDRGINPPPTPRRPNDVDNRQPSVRGDTLPPQQPQPAASSSPHPPRVPQSPSSPTSPSRGGGGGQPIPTPSSQSTPPSAPPPIPSGRPQPTAEATTGDDGGDMAAPSATLGGTLGGASTTSTNPGAPASTVGQVLLPFIRAVHDMEQLPLSDVTQRASRRRFLASFYASSLPATAKNLVDAITSVNDTIRLDVFETPLPTSQVGRSARIGIQTAVRGALSKLRTLKAQVESLLNELNELAEQDEPELEVPERELEDCEGGGGGANNKKKKSDEEEELRREAQERDRDELYDVCDQLYTDVLVPRIDVAETLLLSRSALALRTDDLCSFANKSIQLCYKIITKAELAKLPSFGQILWSKYTATTDYMPPPTEAEGGTDTTTTIPLSWLTNDVLDDCEEAMVDAHNKDASTDVIVGGANETADADDAASKRKEINDCERKTLISLRIAVQEVPEQSRFMMDAVGSLCAVYTALEGSTDEELEGGGEGMGLQLDALCDKLLSLGMMDAEMWLQDLIRSAALQRNNAKKFNPGASSALGSSRKGSFGASLKQSTIKRTMSFGSSMKTGGNNSHSSPPQGLQRSLSGVLTPKQRMNMPSMNNNNHDGDEVNFYDSEGDDEGMFSKSVGGDSSFMNTLTASGNGGIGNSIEMLMQRLDGILGTPPPQTTSECLAVTSKLYDTLGRINMFLRRNGMAQETKVTSAGKVVPTASDDTKVYLEHATDEAQGFSKAESVLYEQGCLCFEMWSQQNKIRQELDELAVSCDDEFFRSCHEDLLAGLLNKADEFCVITESRTTVAKRLDRLMVVRVKIYHHSGEVRVLTLPQRTSLHDLQKQLSEYLPDTATCDVFFLDDGDRVRISTDKEFEELMRMRRGVVLEGMSLGASQLGKSLMSNSELKLELYLDPSLTKLAKAKAAAATKSNVGRSSNITAASANRAALSPPTSISTAPPPSSTNSGAGARAGGAGYKSLPPDYRSTGGMSLNEIIRKQEEEDAAKGVEYQTGSVDLTRFFDRKVAEKGLSPPPPPQSTNLNQVRSHQPSTSAAVPSSSAPRPSAPPDRAVVVPPIPKGGGGAAPSGGGPGEVLFYINKKQEEEHEKKKAAQTRNLFLAMGKGKKGGGGGGDDLSEAPPGGPGYHTMDPSVMQQVRNMQHQKPSTAQGGGVNLWGSMRSPRDTVSVSSSSRQQQRPSSHAGGYQPGESVALTPNRPGQWRPSTHNESLQLAQHPAQGTTRVKDAKEMLQQYLDDDEPDHGSQPWERGTDNHVQAVLYGGGGVSASPTRHNGPTRRAGVPLPPQARPSPKR